MLTPSERRHLMAAASIDERTIKRWESGRPIREASEIRIGEGLAKCGISVEATCAA